MLVPWIRKYCPEKPSEVEGQDRALVELEDFIENYSKQKKKAVLVHGPSGSGKTCSVYTIANKTGCEVVEINASDFRNKAMIEERLGNALKQRSLFSSGKVILVDEVDGLSGTKDRGGVAAITRLLKDSQFPVIMTATNPWVQKLNSLRNKSNLIEFGQLEYLAVFNVLKRVAEAEKIKFNEDDLKTLAIRAGGDLRASINDLQTLTSSGELKKEGIDELSDRNRVESMMSALVKVLKSTKAEVALEAFDSVQEDFDQRFLWLDENIPVEYKKADDLARAYDMMSKADVYRGRIRRWQHWRFLVYVNSLLTVGVATAKDEKYPGPANYKPTSRIMKLFWAKQKNMKKKAIAGKIAERTHSSMRRVLADSLPYLKFICEKDNSFAEELGEDMELDKEEVGWLAK